MTDDESTPWSKQENAGSIVGHAHTDAQRTVNLNPNHCPNKHDKELTGCLEQPNSQSAHAAKG